MMRLNVILGAKIASNTKAASLGAICSGPSAEPQEAGKITCDVHYPQRVPYTDQIPLITASKEPAVQVLGPVVGDVIVLSI